MTIISAVVLIVLSLCLLWLAQRSRGRSGLPKGQVIYTDTGAWRRPKKPLFSRQFLLTGKPDYLVKDGDALTPVEVKSGHAPTAPYTSHILQLAAYCLLVEETYGRRPSHGIIKYADRSFKVTYRRALRDQLLQTLDHMRADLRSECAMPNHTKPSRCAGCGHREHCKERLT